MVIKWSEISWKMHVASGGGSRVRLVVGAAGGPKITTTVAQIVARTILFEQPLATAVSLPRLHHQLLPQTLEIEQQFDRVWHTILVLYKTNSVLLEHWFIKHCIF